MSAAAIRLSRLSRRYDSATVLDAVNLDIRPGEFLTLVGPSGCGKSTLLRLIAGLEQADAGQVFIDEESQSGVLPADRDLAMVFQSYALYPHLTVRENLLVPLALKRLRRHQRLPWIGSCLGRKSYEVLNKEVESVASTLGLLPLLARKPGELSGGQRQRVALGRAMVRQPRAFLMDEPLSNLDASLRVHMRAELTALHRSVDATFIYVTHDQAEALTLSDRVAVMMHGQILQIDSPDQVYLNPSSLEVARFIGSPAINILPAIRDASGHLDCLGIGFGEVRAGSNDGFSLGLRPESLAVLPDTDSVDIGWRGSLVHRELNGADTYVHVAIEGAPSPVVARTSLSRVARVGLGDPIVLIPRMEGSLLFGADGKRCKLDRLPPMPHLEVA